MKLKVQAQHLQPGDIVGSGEVVHSLIRDSVHWHTSKICVRLHSKTDPNLIGRECMWSKYTMINVERPEKIEPGMPGYFDSVLKICKLS